MSSASQQHLVVVSGRSGSGKSTALHVLEDGGFYCVDNLPAGMLGELVARCAASPTAATRRIAVSIDARNLADELSRFDAILRGLPAALRTDIVYLDAEDGVLLKRFSETRRRHPLSGTQRSLQEALQEEHRLLGHIADMASVSVDTSRMSLHELRETIARGLLEDTGTGMLVQFESFGFKHGLPLDADIVFDLRCLPNPHWIAELQHLDGREAPVIRFLEQAAEVREMLDDIAGYLEKWLPRYTATNRSYVTIALGCTGGRHRSVYMCEKLLERFRGAFPRVLVRHREL